MILDTEIHILEIGEAVENDKVGVRIVAENLFHNVNNFFRHGGEAIYGSAEPHRLVDEQHLNDWTVVLVVGFKQRPECRSVLSKCLCSKSQVFICGDSAVDIGAGTLKPIIVPYQIENWVRTGALRVKPKRGGERERKEIKIQGRCLLSRCVKQIAT